MNGYLRVTEVLALAGVVDYSWCTEEGQWRGSELHRAVHLANKGVLKRSSVPERIEDYFLAFERFKSECNFVVVESEREVESKHLRLRGRFDAIGFLHGQKGIIDFKSGAMRPATKLQLCLYGHMYDSEKWMERWGVQLMEDGEYRLAHWPLAQWATDLATAMACVRVAHFKIANGLA